MKKLFTIIFLFLILASYSQDYDFRKTTWGMSPERVKENETSELVESSENRLTYNTTAAGLDALIFYYFMDNQLIDAGYAFASVHINKELYIKDYEDVSSILKKKYGEPDKDEMIWKDDRYKGSKQDWGMAVYMGHLEMNEEWETERTTIDHVIHGGDYEFVHLLLYASLDLMSLRNKEYDKVLDDF